MLANRTPGQPVRQLDTVDQNNLDHIYIYHIARRQPSEQNPRKQETRQVLPEMRNGNMVKWWNLRDPFVILWWRACRTKILASILENKSDDPNFVYIPMVKSGVMKNYQPKQCTIQWKSLKITIHLHCLIPKKIGNLITSADYWVPFLLTKTTGLSFKLT